MPLFHRSDDDPAAQPEGVDQIESALELFSPLTLPQRAAEILSANKPPPDAGDERQQDMGSLLRNWLPDEQDTGGWSREQRLRRYSLEVLLNEAVQVLAFTRMLVKVERSSSMHGTTVGYVTSLEGRAALERGDAADVIGRRLPD